MIHIYDKMVIEEVRMKNRGERFRILIDFLCVLIQNVGFGIWEQPILTENTVGSRGGCSHKCSKDMTGILLRGREHPSPLLFW